MTVVSVLVVSSSSAYAGFQATIRVLVYPQLAAVEPHTFVAYERSHQRRISFVVGPLFAFFGATVLAALVVQPDGWTWVAAACFVLIMLATGVAAVPQHRVLTEGFDRAAMTRLLRVDSVRLVLALVACAASLISALS